MNSLLATLLATAAGATLAVAPAAQAQTQDAAGYRDAVQKVSADYKTASAKCDAKKGNDKDICMAEAKVARARGESQAVAKYENSEPARAHAREKVADADYALAKEKCDARSGADKDSCMDNAKSVHTAALADARGGRDGSTALGASGGLIASTDTKDPAKAAAVAKCEQATGGSTTGCLVDSKGNVTTMANRAENATERAADKTRDAASTAVDKTREVAATAVDKTKAVAATVAEKTGLDGAGERLRAAGSTIAQKTESAVDNLGDKTRQAAASARENTKDAMQTAGEKTRDTAATVADRTDRATDKAADNTRDATRDAARGTAVAASDTAITTKVKANIFKEPDLKSMAIHVETEKGVVMLSGFVESKAEADKAVKVAKEVDGVTSVKSAIKVK